MLHPEWSSDDPHAAARLRRFEIDTVSLWPPRRTLSTSAGGGSCSRRLPLVRKEMDFLKAAKEKAQKAALALQGLSPIEITALEATNDDKWGPHGAQMQELAKATSNYEQRALIMAQLWKRLAEEKPELWRHVYKSLAVFDYFIANADMAIVEELRDNIHKLKALSTFEYKDPDGKDQVRKRAPPGKE